MDPLDLSPVATDVYVKQSINFKADVIINCKFDHWQNCGVNEGHDLSEDDFLVLDVDVVVLLVERDEVCEQHRHNWFFVCSHDDVHDEA